LLYIPTNTISKRPHRWIHCTFCTTRNPDTQSRVREHFVWEFENGFDQLPLNETETHALFQIALAMYSLPLGFPNRVSPRIPILSNGLAAF
jgi:hypothetical protein